MLAGTAAAQPWLVPPVAPAESAPRSVVSESTALWLSLGGTGATLGMIGIAAADGDADTLATLGVVGLWLAPTSGHWYAGRAATPGLGLRTAGIGAIFLSAAMNQCFDAECHDPAGIGLAVAGAGAFVLGTIHDLATAPRSARRRNAHERARVQALTVVPSLGDRRAGLALAGRF
jgi:hypothetical protein